MRHKKKSTSIKVALRLIVGLTTILFVLSLTNALNAENVISHKGQGWNAKPVTCGAELENGYYKLTENLTCGVDPAIKINGPARLNLNKHTITGVAKENVCIQIKGNGARVWNGTVTNCKDGIDIKGDSNMIGRVTSSDNARRGFRVRGDKNLLFNCTATNNGRKGFSIEGDKDDNDVVTERANDNLLLKCMAEYNGQQGFIIEIGDYNKIYHSSANANCRDGIEINVGIKNLIINNLVEDNGNKEVCDSFAENPSDPDDKYYYKPWSYAGIDVTDGIKDKDDVEYPSEFNEIKYNRAGCNLGCVGGDDSTCKARYRDFWDENVDENGNCDSTNEWENNSVSCKNAVPETLCADEGDN